HFRSRSDFFVRGARDREWRLTSCRCHTTIVALLLRTRNRSFRYAEPRPLVTADVVLFTMRAEDLAVLLVRRAEAPFEGQWGLPGGVARAHETLEEAASRELFRETAIQGVPLEQLGAFGAPGRDPRGHAVSVAFFSFVVAESHPAIASGVAEAKWIPLRDF